MAKRDFDHAKATDTEAPYPLFVCVCVLFFFFCLSKISEGWTPPPPHLTKIPGSAPVRDISLATKI